MTDRSRRTTLWVTVRAAAVIAVVAGGGNVVLALAKPPLLALQRQGAPPFAALLEGLCAALLVLCWAWLLAAAVLVSTAAVARSASREGFADRADGVAHRTVPAALRRLLLAACGVALGTGAMVLPASATTSPAIPDLSGLDLPGRVCGTPTPWLTVQPGDSLWTIAARLLPPGADDHQVAATSHRLTVANRAVLGPNPDLIHPGTRLRVPGNLRRRDGT